MAEGVEKEFWKKWTEADELEKLRLVETLSVCSLGKMEYEKHTLAVLVNSYLVNLAEYMSERNNGR